MKKTEKKKEGGKKGRRNFFKVVFVNFATFLRDLSGTGEDESQW